MGARGDGAVGPRRPRGGAVAGRGPGRDGGPARRTRRGRCGALADPAGAAGRPQRRRGAGPVARGAAGRRLPGRGLRRRAAPPPRPVLGGGRAAQPGQRSSGPGGRGRRAAPWHTWFGPEGLAGLVPDATQRAHVAADVPRVPLAHLQAVAPPPRGWERVPCGYLRLSEAYAEGEVEAARRGWPTEAVYAVPAGTTTPRGARGARLCGRGYAVIRRDASQGGGRSRVRSTGGDDNAARRPAGAAMRARLCGRGYAVIRRDASQGGGRSRVRSTGEDDNAARRPAGAAMR